MSLNHFGFSAGAHPTYPQMNSIRQQKPKSWTYNLVEVSGHRVPRHEVSVYNVYNTNQLKATFAQGWRGSKIKSVSWGDCE